MSFLCKNFFFLFGLGLFFSYYVILELSDINAPLGISCGKQSYTKNTANLN